jgi:hypothetical protein
MSLVKIQGNASGTGEFTIAAPNSNTNRTLTLPDSSGTLALAGSSLTGVTDSASPFETALGEGAGGSSTGVNNTFIGFEAGNDNTTGQDNTVVGYQALDANTTGVRNTAVGRSALGASTTTNDNAALGFFALLNNTASNNTAIGSYSMRLNTTGANNTAVGEESLYTNTTGASNTAVGYQAAYLTTTAVNSVAIGYQALYNQTTAGNLGWNVGVGLGALSGTTTGYYNIGLGGNAGNTLTTGNSNVFIGTFAAASAVGVSNEAVLGGLTGKGANTFYVMGSSGSYNQKNVTTWETTSDQRLKKNIVDNTEGLEKINALRVRNFEYRLPEEITDLPEHTVIERSGVQLGIIAQELQEVCPTCVTEQSTGVLSVSTDEIFWHMVNAIKQLNAKVESLEAQLQAQTQAPASTQEQSPAEPNA